MMTWAQLGFQDASSPIMEEFLFFHDFAMVILILIIGFVGHIMASMSFNLYINKGLLESQIVECVWTLIPAIILVEVAVPSLSLLYTLDETISCNLTIKAVGHQWYWTYEYSDFKSLSMGVLSFDSYMTPESELEGGPRLLESDNRVVLPFKTHIRTLVTSADVLHSWTVPALGVKVDACPGRLNTVSFLSNRPGVLYGQCSEICGANHSFMPITLELVDNSSFLKWLSLALNE